MVLSISRFSFESRLCMALYAHDICFSFLEKKRKQGDEIRNIYSVIKYFTAAEDAKKHDFDFSKTPTLFTAFYDKFSLFKNENFFVIL